MITELQSYRVVVEEFVDDLLTAIAFVKLQNGDGISCWVALGGGFDFAELAEGAAASKAVFGLNAIAGNG